MELDFINPEPLGPGFGYSHVVAVRGGRTLYISGQVPFNASGELVGTGDMAAQTRQVFENIGVALRSAGGDFDDLVRLNYYLTDMSALPVLREVRDRYVNTAQPPASAAVGVAALFHPDVMIEIQAVAVVP